MCLSEIIFLQKNNISFTCKPGIINFKSNKNRTTILRSPNKNKVAQFHTIKKKYQTSMIMSFFFNKNKKMNIIILKDFLYSTFLNFETPLLFTKSIKINLLKNLKLNKIK